MDEVAIVQGLQPQIGELLVTVGQQLSAEVMQVVFEQAGIQQFQVNGTLDVLVKIIGIEARHFVLGRMGQAVVNETQCLGAHIIQQQPSGGVTVIRLFLDQRACAHDQHTGNIFFRYAIKQIAFGIPQYRRTIDTVQVFAGFADDGLQAPPVQRLPAAIRERNRDFSAGFVGCLVGHCGLLLACAGVFFTVDHVRAGNTLMTRAHQRQFDLVLDVFDVKRAAIGYAAGQRQFDLFGEFAHDIVYATRSCRVAALDRQKRLGHRDRDLFAVVGCYLAVSADDPETARRGNRDIGLADRSWGVGLGLIPVWCNWCCQCHSLSIVGCRCCYAGYYRMWFGLKSSTICCV